MFRGVAHLSLDSKGRLAVPSRYREALLVRCAGRLVITADFDKCLLVYPLPDWEPIQQKLMSLSSLNPRIRDLQRRLIGYAEDIEIDSAGRVLVSSALRDFAALGKHVVLVGQGKITQAQFAFYLGNLLYRVLESILAEKGLIDPKALDALVDIF